MIAVYRFLSLSFGHEYNLFFIFIKTAISYITENMIHHITELNIALLSGNNIKTIIRQVIIKGLNDDEENAKALKELKSKYSCIDKIELLPFKKICKAKYDNLKIKFAFEDKETPSIATLKKLELLIS